ncbi:hypothetical protein BKA56DRAFT_667834 [Ilyonectria sp. MPI-CAGE-AT-0026]|nr:hypothetical protein BKA56DRAFT_667834 [Ilyonectria sp. MPI-CAGE-AT-0026]
MTERFKTTHVLKMEGKEAPPKTYADFPPVGESGKKFPVSPGDVDPTNVGSRRKHMRAFFNYMLPGVEERIYDEMRQDSVKSTCVSLNNARVEAVGTPCFEFLVDRGFWNYWFLQAKRNGYPTPDWPWDKYRPKIPDMAHGRSVVYHEWLKTKKAAENKAVKDEAVEDKAAENEAVKGTAVDETGETGGTAPKGKTQAGSPVAVSEVADKDAESKATTEEPASEQVETRAPTPKNLGSEVVKVRGPDKSLSSSMWAPKVPKPKADLKPTALVFRPRPVTQEPYQRPPIPDEGDRQLAWLTIFGQEEYVRPVCGYFEVLFPRNVPFESFVSGPGGIALKRINEEVIPDQLVITWVDSVPHRVSHRVPNWKEYQEEPWPERLVVGFSDRMSPAAVALQPNQRLLHDLWEDVCGWAYAAWQGYPEILEKFLARRTMERMALKFSMRSRIKRHIALMEASEPEVLAFLAERQEDVLLEKLDAWVFAQGKNMARPRVQVARMIWLGQTEVGQVDLVNVNKWMEDLAGKL